MAALVRKVRQLVIPVSLLALTPAASMAQEMDPNRQIFVVSTFDPQAPQPDNTLKPAQPIVEIDHSVVKKAEPIDTKENYTLDKQTPEKINANSTRPHLKALNEISLDIRPAETPEDQYVGLSNNCVPVATASFMKPFNWVAPGTVHNPLYFEDVALERYGQGCNPCLQPAVSGVRFLADTLLLPYQMGLDCPCELEYSLGYQRPGSCAPPVAKQLPWSWKGALMQAGAVGGGLSLFPL